MNSPFYNGQSYIRCNVWFKEDYSMPAVYDERKQMFLIDENMFTPLSSKIIKWSYSGRDLESSVLDDIDFELMYNNSFIKGYR